MKNKGFTIIELMVVLAIIGILAVIAIPKFQSLADKSNRIEMEHFNQKVSEAEESVIPIGDEANYEDYMKRARYNMYKAEEWTSGDRALIASMYIDFARELREKRGY